MFEYVYVITASQICEVMNKANDLYAQSGRRGTGQSVPVYVPTDDGKIDYDDGEWIYTIEEFLREHDLFEMMFELVPHATARALGVIATEIANGEFITLGADVTAENLLLKIHSEIV